MENRRILNKIIETKFQTQIEDSNLCHSPVYFFLLFLTIKYF